MMTKISAKNLKNLKVLRAIVASLLGLMVLIDVVLVMLEQEGYPTFSWVVRDNRTSLIWLTFLFGGLVAKMFYNRKVHVKDSEVSGFIAFISMVILLFLLGRIIEVNVETPYQLVLLLCGGLLAYRAWPQYSK